MFTIAIEVDGRVVMTGRLDATRASVAQATLDRTQGVVVVDCGALDYLSSAGLGVLLKTQKRLMATHGGLRLEGVHRALLEIFTYSGFDRIFEIVPAA